MEEDAFDLRNLTWPEEDRRLYTSTVYSGGHRWFDLERDLSGSISRCLKRGQAGQETSAAIPATVPPNRGGCNAGKTAFLGRAIFLGSMRA